MEHYSIVGWDTTNTGMHGLITSNVVHSSVRGLETPGQPERFRYSSYTWQVSVKSLNVPAWES